MRHLVRFLLLVVLVFSACGDPRQRQQVAEETTDPFLNEVHLFHRIGLGKNFSLEQMDSIAALARRDSLNRLRDVLIRTGDLFPLDISTEKRSCFTVYENIIAEIGAHWPDLKADSTHFEYIPEEPGGKDTGWVIMHIKIGGHAYVRRLYWFDDAPMDETFCKVYNLVLAERKSQDRVFLASFQCQDCFNPFDDGDIKNDIRRIGLIRLTHPQADSLLANEELGLDPEPEFDIFTQKETEAYISKFLTTGLIRKEDSAEFSTARTNALQTTLYGPDDFYEFMDSLFTNISYDANGDYHSYETMLSSLSSISRGYFELSGYSEEIDQATGVSTVVYSIGKKNYEHTYTTKHDLVSPQFLIDFNHDLAEQQVGGSFWTIYVNDQITMVVFIRDEVVEQVRKSNFFPVLEQGSPQIIRTAYNQP